MKSAHKPRASTSPIDAPAGDSAPTLLSPKQPLWLPSPVSQQIFDISRSCYLSMLSTTESYLQLTEEIQLIRVQILEDIRNQCMTALHDAEGSQSLETLWGKLGQLSTQQVSVMANRWTSLSSRLLGAQSHFVEEVQAQSARIANQWITSSLAATTSESAQPSTETSSPFRGALFGSAQSAWAQIAKQWIESGKQATNHALKEHA